MTDDDRAPPPTLAERERASFATLRATHPRRRRRDGTPAGRAERRGGARARRRGGVGRAPRGFRRDATRSSRRCATATATRSRRRRDARAPPSPARPRAMVPAAEEMRRSRKAAVRHKRFGEALDLLQRISDKETEEMEAHRERVRAENARALERAFERHREERARAPRGSRRRGGTLRADAKALRAATREWGRRAEEEAARRLVSLAAGHQSPSRNGAANRARTKVEVEVEVDDRDRATATTATRRRCRRAHTGSARDDSIPTRNIERCGFERGFGSFPRPTRLPPGPRTIDMPIWRRSGTTSAGSTSRAEPPTAESPSPGEYASIRSPCAAVHRRNVRKPFGTCARRRARDESRRVVGDFFSPRSPSTWRAHTFYQNLGVADDMLRLSYSARGDDALSTRDAIPSRDGISTRDGIPAEDAAASEDATRCRLESRGRARTSSIRLNGPSPSSRFDPALQHMVSLEQRRAWEERVQRSGVGTRARRPLPARARLRRHQLLQLRRLPLLRRGRGQLEWRHPSRPAAAPDDRLYARRADLRGGYARRAGATSTAAATAMVGLIESTSPTLPPSTADRKPPPPANATPYNYHDRGSPLPCSPTTTNSTPPPRRAPSSPSPPRSSCSTSSPSEARAGRRRLAKRRDRGGFVMLLTAGNQRQRRRHENDSLDRAPSRESARRVVQAPSALALERVGCCARLLRGSSRRALARPAAPAAAPDRAQRPHARDPLQLLWVRRRRGAARGGCSTGGLRTLGQGEDERAARCSRPPPPRRSKDPRLRGRRRRRRRPRGTGRGQALFRQLRPRPGMRGRSRPKTPRATPADGARPKRAKESVPDQKGDGASPPASARSSE